MVEVDFDKVINRYGTYSTQWDYVKDRFGEGDLLPFTISDMDFKAPDGVNEVIIKAAQRGVFGYTRWNHEAFKGTIAKWYQKRYEADIDPEWVVYSPSVIFSLAKLVEQYSNIRDLIVTFSPCYDAFISTIKANQRRLVQMNIAKGLDFNELEHIFKYEHPAIFLLCNPQNPLGIVWTDEQMQKIVDLCNDYQVALISDEIHLDILREGVAAHSLIAYSHELKVDFAVLSSATKAFNIPALGCSYALIPDQLERLKFLHMLKQKNALSSVPYLGMLALIECYQNQESWLDQLNHYLDHNFMYLKQFLKKHLNLSYQIPDATYLAWIDIHDLNVSMTDLQHELVTHQKVAIMDGRIYGNGGTDHLRLNLGAPRSKIVSGLNRLDAAVKTLQK